MNAIDSRLRVTAVFWLGVACLFSVFIAYMFATDIAGVLLVVAGVGWLVLLPYHTQLSAMLSMATFSSALIVPFFPGRPFFWEFAALLAWSGLVITISLRRYAEDSARVFQENKWLFVGVIGYCAVLLVTMVYRGVGLRIFGGEQMGGRSYFQQLACAIFPFLFLLCRLDRQTMVKLFIFQCLLTSTFLVSDFVFSRASQVFFPILQFFELPNDAVNFEAQSLRHGIRRFQSLGTFGQGMIVLLLVLVPLRSFLSTRGFFLVPATVGLLGMGVLSGHRYLILIVGITFIFCMAGQRMFNVRKMILIGFVMLIGLGLTYLAAPNLPLAAQRSVSFLPGIQVDAGAKADASVTLFVRERLRTTGMAMIPDYLWMGRGFGMSSLTDYSLFWDPTTITLHVNQGRFYNGFIGLMVNTGVVGTFFMMMFLFSGTATALKVIFGYPQEHYESQFHRLACVVASLWMANTIAFLFFHGDSEWAMKTFALQAGLLLSCKALLNMEERQGAPETA